METVCSRAGGLANFVGGVEHGLLFEQGAGHRQQAIGDGRRARPWLWPRWRSGICGAAGRKEDPGETCWRGRYPQPARNVLGDRAHPGGAGGATSSPADRHEVVYANALHMEDLDFLTRLERSGQTADEAELVRKPIVLYRPITKVFGAAPELGRSILAAGQPRSCRPPTDRGCRVAIQGAAAHCQIRRPRPGPRCWR